MAIISFLLKDSKDAGLMGPSNLHSIQQSGPYNKSWQMTVPCNKLNQTTVLIGAAMAEQINSISGKWCVF